MSDEEDELILAAADLIRERRNARIAERLGISENGKLTWDGEVVDYCPHPFADCRPGACNCDGMRDHWKMYGSCNRVLPHTNKTPGERCAGTGCAQRTDIP